MRFKKIYVEITNECNLSCPFCPPHGRPRKAMSRAEFLRVLERAAPFGKYLYFHVKGEPLIHPDVDFFVSEAASRGFFVCLTTNGTLLLEHLAALSPVRQINLSLHATGDMELVRELRRREDAPPVSLRLWNGTSEMLGLLEEEFSVKLQPDMRRQKLTERIFLSLEDSFSWPDMESAPLSERGFCLGLRDQIAVLADGTVTPCCLDHRGDIALGNIFAQEIGDILASPRAAAIRDGFSRRAAVEPLCRRCGFKSRFDKN